MALADILKAKQEQAEREAAEAKSGQSNHATGLATTSSTAGHILDQELNKIDPSKLLQSSTSTVDQTGVETLETMEVKKGPPGSYRAIRLKRYFDPNGNKIEPNADGFYIPVNDWERSELEHFAKGYELVEYQGEEKERGE